MDVLAWLLADGHIDEIGLRFRAPYSGVVAESYWSPTGSDRRRRSHRHARTATGGLALKSPLPYRLGLPAWAFSGWKGSCFPPKQPMLESYARVFNTVEGNTTFYAIPNAKTVAAWREAVGGTDFRFCFKLPRTVTHARVPDFDDLDRFLRAIEPLGDHLGPLLLQLPATVGPDRLGDLERLLVRLPPDLRSVIEVRHQAFFERPGLLLPLLERFRLGRVVLDARPLHEGDPRHPDVLAARHEKPRLPVQPEPNNGLSFVRLVLHPDLASNTRYIDEWAPRVAAHIDDGIDSYMLIHCPNNLYCPPLARRFHETLCQTSHRHALAPLPPWPLLPQERLI